MGSGWPLKRNDTLGIYLPPNHVLWCIERQATFYCSVDAPKELKIKKYAMWQIHPYPHSIYTPRAAYINFGMWGRVLDVINHAKFQLDRFRGFGAPGGRKSLSPMDSDKNSRRLVALVLKHYHWENTELSILRLRRFYTVNHKKTWHFIFDYNFG